MPAVFPQLIEREKGGKEFSPPLDEVTIRPFPLGVEQEDGEGRGRVALARGEGGEFGREVECLCGEESGVLITEKRQT